MIRPDRDKMDLKRNWPNCALLYKIPLTGDMKALWKIPLLKYNLVLTVLIWICTALLLKFLIFKIKKEKMEVPESWNQKRRRTVLSFK